MSLDANLSRPRWAGWILVTLLLAHLGLKLAIAPQMVDAPFTGDERAYVDAAKALSNVTRDLVHANGLNVAELSNYVVGNGWFMPGMPFVMTPLYAVSPDAGLGATRIYLGLFTLLLLGWAVGELRSALGTVYASALAAFPSLLPTWIMFSFTAWGDLSAGLLLVVVFARTIRMARLIAREEAPSVRDGLKLGALLAACLYLRSSVLPLVPALILLLVIGAGVLLRGRARKIGLCATGAAAAAFLTILLPWSLAASTVLKAPVMTTTTVPLSMAVTFGDINKVCFGSCGPGNIWFNAVHYARATAEKSGGSEVEVQKRMSAFARQGVTASRYCTQVLKNFRNYLMNPAAFLKRFLPRSAPEWKRAVYSRATAIPYFFGLAFLAGGMIAVFRGPLDRQIVSVVLKLFAGAALMQPFIHQAHGRYWPFFAPLIALSATMLLQKQSVAGASEGGVKFCRAMMFLQYAGATGVVLAVAVILTVAGS